MRSPTTAVARWPCPPYRTGEEKIEAGPKAIAEKWALADGLSQGIDASRLVPGSTTDLYSFKGDVYERVH